MSLDQVAEKALELDAERFVLVERWKMGFGKISLFLIASNEIRVFPPAIFLSAIQLKRNFKKRIRCPASAITVESQHLHKNEKLSKCLSNFFGLPIAEIDDSINKRQSSMHISNNPKGHLQINFIFLQGMIEIGPRITVSKLSWDVN
ncbi:MAG: hypothetical protein P8Y18_08715 [Candidatus Bathyarchaeota archaeon]